RDQVDRRRDVEGLEPHVDQTRDRGGRVVRVQRGEHEVAGERRLDGDGSRFQVTDLTDHDDVRVLAQEGAQRRGEVQTDLGSDLHLVDAVQVVLDRVLGGHDVDLRGVDLGQGGVERGRLTRTGRAGD